MILFIQSFFIDVIFFFYITLSDTNGIKNLIFQRQFLINFPAPFRNKKKHKLPVLYL